MQTTGIVRPIDSLGRIVLPIELRKNLNLETRDLLEIFLKDDSIVLKKHQKSCVFCKGEKDLTEINGKYICKDCQFKIKEKCANCKV